MIRTFQHRYISILCCDCTLLSVIYKKFTYHSTVVLPGHHNNNEPHLFYLKTRHELCISKVHMLNPQPSFNNRGSNTICYKPRKKLVNPLTPELNPSAQPVPDKIFLLGILPLEPCISLIYA
jgi:hypothetical protein